MSRGVRGLLAGGAVAVALGVAREAAPAGAPCEAFLGHLAAPSGDIVAESGCAELPIGLTLSFRGDVLLDFAVQAPDANRACWERFIAGRRSTRSAKSAGCEREERSSCAWWSVDGALVPDSGSVRLTANQLGRGRSTGCGGGGVAY